MAFVAALEGSAHGQHAFAQQARSPRQPIGMDGRVFQYQRSVENAEIPRGTGVSVGRDIGFSAAQKRSRRCQGGPSHQGAEKQAAVGHGCSWFRCAA